ncbi:MAG: AtpZ/AtpI family protein [Armatimonadota bacterium]
MPKEWRRSELGGLALIAGGFLLVAMTLGGYVVGHWLDRIFHTGSLLSIIGLLFGTFVGFWDLYRIAMRVMNQQPPPPPPLNDDQQFSDNNEADEDTAGDRDNSHE